MSRPAATRELERMIVDSVFVPRLRRFQVDRDEYARLCGALEELARHWRGSALVDREAAAALHALFAAARDVIPSLGRADPRLRDEMEDMGIRLAALVRECFSPGAAGGPAPIDEINTVRSLDT
jgi:hypothetical protein